jgi:hypothetical protein
LIGILELEGRGSGEGTNLTTHYLKSLLWLVYSVMFFSNM